MHPRAIILIVAILLVLPAVHAASVSISQAGADPNTVMKGTSFTVTVSGLSDSGSVSLVLPSGFSTDENTTKTFGGGTTSVSWTTVVANQKLSAQTISASISTTGSPETVTTSSFDVILPPSIVTSVSPSAISNPSAGSSHTINLNIQNYGETVAKDVVVALSLPSGFSLYSGQSTQTISTISGGVGGSGESVGISWTITAGSPSTSTISIAATPSNAGSKTDTISVSVAGGDDEGDGVRGGGIPTSFSKTHTWTQMTPGKAEIMKINDREIGFKQIEMTVNNPANNVKITVTKLSGQPATVVHQISGKVYQYVEIVHENLPNEIIYSAGIKFNVSKSWMIENRFAAGDIFLARYTNGWSRLPTTKISENNEEAEYEAAVPGLSIFAIAAEKATEPPPAPVSQPTPPAPIIPIPPETIEAVQTHGWAIVLVVLVIIFVLGWLYYYGHKRFLWNKPRPTHKKDRATSRMAL